MDTKKLIESQSSSEEIIQNITEGLKVKDFDRGDRQAFMGASDFPDGTPPQIAHVNSRDIDWDSFNMEPEGNRAWGTFVLGYDPQSDSVSLDFILNTGGSGMDADQGYLADAKNLDDGLRKLYAVKTPVTRRQLEQLGFDEGY